MEVRGEAYQQAHGEWMRNRTGSGLDEVHAVALVGPLAIFALKLIKSSKIIPQLTSDTGVRSTRHWFVTFFFEFAVGIVPQLAVVTCPCITNNLGIAGVVMCMIISIIFAKSALRFARLTLTEKTRKDIESVFHGSTQGFVTSFRAGTVLMTVICILAVDFPVFPVRFAKTETYGTSLMDAGVGMFVVANAIVSPEARLSSSLPVKSVRSSGPILVLGLGRVVVLKAIGYHDNPAEYGTHWNFFFTLALIRISAALILSLNGSPRQRGRVALLAALVIMSGYQLLLSKFGLGSYILGMEGWDSVQTTLGNILHHNRGGIASCAGFLSLYLFGVAVGCTIFAELKRSIWQTFNLISKLFGISLLMLVLLIASCTYVESASRRLANLSYVISVVMLASWLIAALMAVDLCVAILAFNGNGTGDFYKIMSPPIILDAINRHGLAVFLLANVLTGVINLSVATMYAPTSTSLSILIAYLMSITIVTSLWERRQIVRKIS